MWSGYVTISGIFGGDGLFLGLCVHISGEFNIVSARISKLIEGEISEHESSAALIWWFPFILFRSPESHESIESFSQEENDRLYVELRKIVEEHETLIELCRKLSKSLSANVFIHFISSAIVTCVCCLTILLSEGADKLIFVNYIIASTCQVFVYSMGGNLLADSSAEIQEAAYNFQWYKCNKKIRKLIQMIMIRAQRKTAVEVPFFQTSLETFGSVSGVDDFMVKGGEFT